MIELLVVIAIIALLAATLLPAIQRAREMARRSTCGTQMKELLNAMHLYEGVHRKLPGSQAAKPGRFSIHVELLPQLELNTLYDRINFNLTEPTITGVTAGSGLATEAQITWNPNLTAANKEAAPDGGAASPKGGHRLAATTNIQVFNCPSDSNANGVNSGVSYVPVVTTEGARLLTATGEKLVALWPPSNEGHTTIPASAPVYAAEMNPISIASVPDGSTNTIALVERIKGKRATGRASEAFNMTYTGSQNLFIVKNGVVITDNGAGVAACRTAKSNGTTAGSPDPNELSGSIWFQYTCRWMGCANMMAPPNSPVCTGTGGPANADIAASGIAPPSSNHGGGANVGYIGNAVKFMTDQTDLKVIHALGTISGGEAEVNFN